MHDAPFLVDYGVRVRRKLVFLSNSEARLADRQLPLPLCFSRNNYRGDDRSLLRFFTKETNLAV